MADFDMRMQTMNVSDFRRTLTGAAAALAVALVPTADAAAQEEVRISGDRVAIYNIAGAVEIVRGSGSDVMVEVMRGGDDASQLRLETGEIRGRETLRIIYPSDEVVYDELGRWSKSQIRVRDDGTWGNGGGGDRVEVSGGGGGLEAHADLRVHVPAGTDLEMYLAVGEIDARDIQGDLTLDTHSGDVTAMSITGDLLVDTGSGSVEVDGVDGNVNVDTGSGSVEVLNARGEELMVDTGSGRVEGSEVVFGSVNVDTGSGSVEFERLSAADIRVDTGSGSVELDLLTDVDFMEVDTGSGSVTVWVPEDFGARVEFDTGSGGIDLDVPVSTRSMRRDYISGTIGDGQGSMTLDTGSGGIRIRQH
jgi:hypothetical protein